jgi:hypothetical protein
MHENFTYTDLSLNGLLEAFSKHYGVKIKDNQLVLPLRIGNIKMQGLTLPGDIEVLFTEYEYACDMYILHTEETKQKLVLWVALSEGDDQEFHMKATSEETLITTSGKFQSRAYLMNSLFPFGHLRKKGTKGKTIMIFIPPYLLESFGKNNSNEALLGKYYALQVKGLSLITLSQNEINIVNDFFAKWRQNQNIIALAKYSFQLLEWYINFRKQKHKAYIVYSLLWTNVFTKPNLTLLHLQKTAALIFQN